MSELDEKARKTALTLALEGIAVADPETAIKNALKYAANKLKVKNEEIPLKGRVYVIGAGKASGGMAKAVEEIMGEIVEDGVVAVPEEIVNDYSLKKIRLVGSTHPRPSEKSVHACNEILKLVSGLSEDDVVLALISGGGSALIECPVEGVTIEDMAEVSIALMNAGADIFELNTVRKHLSRIKGGWLARHAYPATLVALMISDVVGDRMDTIASGPTVPDPTTFQDAAAVLQRRKVWDKASPSIKEYITKGLRGEVPETPKPGDPIFRKVHNHVIASNIDSLKAMQDKAQKLGYNAIILTAMLEGEAREVGKVAAAIAKETLRTGHPIEPPAVILAGGETTVTVTGKGKGGRNQELALAAAIEIKGLTGVAIASIGSDGRDGPTDAAGAVVDGKTVEIALEKGLDPIKYLANNDSYSFFAKAGGHVKTGYTGTNVNDFLIIVVEKKLGA